MSLVERRRHPRRGEIEVEYQLADGGPTHRARTQNVSGGGAFVVTADPEEPGTRLKLRLLVDGKSLDVAGEVRWTSRYREAPGMGVHFDGDHDAIHVFLGAHESA